MRSASVGRWRITAAVFYDDPSSAIDWLCRALRFEVCLKVEDDERGARRVGRTKFGPMTFLLLRGS